MNFLTFWQGRVSRHGVDRETLKARYAQYQIGRGTMTQKVRKH